MTTPINIIKSEFPKDYIPADGKVFVGIDYGDADCGCEVKGFYKDGIWHVQEINVIAPQQKE